MSSFPVLIQDEAVTQLKKILDRKGDVGSFIRVGVKGGGCSGLEYVLKLDTEPIAGDIEFETEGLKVACDPKSAMFLQGSELVWTGNLMAGGFEFVNPNAARSCGCGTSFTPKQT